jgi:ATP-dependent exoDNAse (exonuclease V) alpha subunit
VQLRGTCVAGDRPRRRREDDRHARPRPGLDRRRRPSARPGPSAAAAAVLAEQTGIRSDTLAKLTWSLQHGDLPDWAAAIGPSTLVIIDEAGMADTLSLDSAVQFAIDRGASVRLVGDDQQLAAIGAGGVLRDITNTYGASD